jgi:O-acetyl-ADP-ribose deacetylase (regulator of RNase III)
MIIDVLKGDLVKLLMSGKFNAGIQGTNCQNIQRKGLAKYMTEVFHTDTFLYEHSSKKGMYEKLGNIDWGYYTIDVNSKPYLVNLHKSIFKKVVLPSNSFYIINCYIQYMWATEFNPKPIDYNALALCFTKINHLFKDYHLGIPKIGAGLAGGDWELILKIINKSTPDVDITLVEL